MMRPEKMEDLQVSCSLIAEEEEEGARVLALLRVSEALASCSAFERILHSFRHLLCPSVWQALS